MHRKATVRELVFQRPPSRYAPRGMQSRTSVRWRHSKQEDHYCGLAIMTQRATPVGRWPSTDREEQRPQHVASKLPALHHCVTSQGAPEGHPPARAKVSSMATLYQRARSNRIGVKAHKRIGPTRPHQHACLHRVKSRASLVMEVFRDNSRRAQDWSVPESKERQLGEQHNFKVSKSTGFIPF